LRFRASNTNSWCMRVVVCRIFLTLCTILANDSNPLRPSLLSCFIIFQHDFWYPYHTIFRVFLLKLKFNPFAFRIDFGLRIGNNIAQIFWKDVSVYRGFYDFCIFLLVRWNVNLMVFSCSYRTLTIAFFSFQFLPIFSSYIWIPESTVNFQRFRNARHEVASNLGILNPNKLNSKQEKYWISFFF